MMRVHRLGENPVNGDVHYHIDDGRRLTISRDELFLRTETEVLRLHGLELSSRRVPVMRGSEQVGTLPADFDWRSFKPSFMVDLRPGDFIWKGDHWEASRTLGMGDLEYIPEFRRSVRN